MAVGETDEVLRWSRYAARWGARGRARGRGEAHILRDAAVPPGGGGARNDGARSVLRGAAAPVAGPQRRQLCRRRVRGTGEGGDREQDTADGR